MSDPARPCSRPEARQFDFWLGEWDLIWPAEQAGGEPGTTMTGSNRIEKLFGPCVIEESFESSDGFQGRSLSVYDAAAGVWRQTWVDNAGGYVTFTGGMMDDEMVLSTEPVTKAGEMMINRMVFSQITTNSLYWQWQKTNDGGTSWTDRWTITYQRRV